MLLARVQHFLHQHDLAAPGVRVVAAVSGGSDSVALALLLHDLDAAGELTLAGLAHFNHQLRPNAVDRGDVAARAKRERRSIEDAARVSRHEFLERARLELGAEAVAVGHTR